MSYLIPTESSAHIGTRKCPYCGAPHVLLPQSDLDTMTFFCGTQKNWVMTSRTDACRAGNWKERENQLDSPK